MTTPDRTFTLERRTIDDATFLFLDGPLRLGHKEASTGRQLSESVKEVVETGICSIAIDLRGLVKTPDSSGLGELVAAESALRQRGGKLVLVNVPPKLRTLIETMGLDRLFHIVDTEAEALTILARA